MPAVLVEMGFLSNYSERKKLLSGDYQEILSQRIAEGIINEINRKKCREYSAKVDETERELQ